MASNIDLNRFNRYCNSLPSILKDYKYVLHQQPPVFCDSPFLLRHSRHQKSLQSNSNPIFQTTSSLKLLEPRHTSTFSFANQFLPSSLPQQRPTTQPFPTKLRTKSQLINIICYFLFALRTTQPLEVCRFPEWPTPRARSEPQRTAPPAQAPAARSVSVSVSASPRPRLHRARRARTPRRSRRPR